MKQHDYWDGWWHLLPNICLLTAIIGQFNPTALNSPTWGRISTPPLAPKATAPLAPKVIDKASIPIFSVKTPVQFALPIRPPEI
jgi:hypothetical protein